MGGIPCSATAWNRLFPQECHVEQKIVPFFDIFSKNYQNRNFYDLVCVFKDIIQNYKPDEIYLHDISVTLGLLALIKINKSSQDPNFKPRIIIFNGAFRGFNVFKALHPLRIQWISFESFEKTVALHGGDVDLRFKLVFTNLRYLYRQLAFSSAISIIKNFFKSSITRKINLRCKILILASKTDPYIPFECLRFIERDFSNSELKIIDYGHFPYSGDIGMIREQINDFCEGSPHVI